MTTYLTWDGDVANGVLPRRPSTDDLGGDQYEDDAESPPDLHEFPSAADFNQLVKQIAALSKCVAAAKIETRFNAGAPFIQRASGPGTAIVPSLFTVVDNGVGDTSVTWPVNTFPTPQISPSGLTVFSSAATHAEGQIEEITNGIRVRTFQNAVAADLPWTAEIN